MTRFLPSRNFLLSRKNVAFDYKIKSCCKETNGLQSITMAGEIDLGKIKWYLFPMDTLVFHSTAISNSFDKGDIGKIYDIRGRTIKFVNSS